MKYSSNFTIFFIVSLPVDSRAAHAGDRGVDPRAEHGQSPQGTVGWTQGQLDGVRQVRRTRPARDGLWN